MAGEEGNLGRDPYEKVLERARQLANQKRVAGELPEGLTEALDSLFIEVAPPGARATSEGLEGLLEVLARYNFDPTVPVESTRPGLGWFMTLLKRLLRPITSWQLRHVTDQLNAYHAAQAELLKAVIREMDRKS